MLVGELWSGEVDIGVELLLGVAPELVGLTAPGDLVEALGELLVQLQRIILIHPQAVLFLSEM